MTKEIEAPLALTPPPVGSISIVTVTYGDRGHLVEQVVAACLSDPAIADVHVVNNNSKSDLSTLGTRWGDRVKIVTLPRNSGSAVGFGKGIESALASGRPYIMLLDDDNAPDAGCIPALFARLEERCDQLGPERVAVFALREFEHGPYLDGLKPEWHYPRLGSFLGFSLRQTLQRKIGMRSHQSPAERPSFVSLPHGIYGGMMARRDLFETLGMPNQDMVLYADDVEYTQRVVAAAGTLDLVTDARIIDLDGRHTADVSEKSFFRALLKAPSHFRLYYATRNSVWLSKRRSKGHRLAYAFNRAVYLFMMQRNARQMGHPQSYEIFLAAVRDGEAGRLGENDHFPLPQ